MTQRGEHYDDLEIREPERREGAQFEALRDQISSAKQHGPAWGRILSGIEADDVTSRAALAKLPVTRKSELMELQKANRPLGGLTTRPPGEMSWVFCSPGPIYEPGIQRRDYWRMGRALYAAGIRPGDIAYNTFAYHLTPAGHMMEAGAHACGAAVVPGGVGNTEQQIQAINDIRPNAYVGTPSFLRILFERAREAGLDTSSITKASVGGEALPPSLRDAFKTEGVAVLQSYGTADIGLIAYETTALEGMVIDEGVIVEIVTPGTGDPVTEGEVGEVVVSVLNPDYPLVRFATGDLSAVLPGQSACGRTNTRLKGWMGRADQTTKVRGMFVHPVQVGQVVARHPEIGKARLVIENPDQTDRMTLRCEVAGGDGGDKSALKSEIESSVQSLCKVKGIVAFTDPGSLPDDGKVIDDIRVYE
jgi:phenylacetate-CoA ligase